MRSAPDQDRGLSKWTVTSGAWILAGFLLITIALILTAREDDRNFPSVTNTRASGYAAFAELLRRDGFKVELDRSVRPSLGPDDVVLMPSFDEGYEDRTNDPYAEEPPPEKSPYTRLITNHLKQGGKVIEVYNAESYPNTSSLLQNPRLAESSKGRNQLTLTVPYSISPRPSIETTAQPYTAWYVDDEAFVQCYSVESGLYITLNDGVIASNRLLDEQDNAAFLLDIVRSVAKPGSRLVFLEGGIGNAEAPSPTNTLGPWAETARWQIVVLFLVLLYTLGRRFGLPETEKRQVRGSRELFDAIADVFRRTGNTGLALENLLAETETRVRKTLNVSPARPRREVFDMVPADLKDQFFQVAVFASLGVTPHDASREARKLIDILEAFERDSRASRGLKR